MGIAVLSHLPVQAALASGRLAEIHLRGFSLRRLWHVAWRADRRQMLAARSLVEYLRSQARTQVASMEGV